MSAAFFTQYRSMGKKKIASLIVPSGRVGDSFERMIWYRRFVDWKRTQRCAVVESRIALYDRIKDVFSLDYRPIDYLEFGVYEGRSFKKWLCLNSHSESRFYGFDTFVGLPEKWDWCERGHFSTGGKVPECDDSRSKFIKGTYQNSLMPFLQGYTRGERLVLHIDCDLFSSTLYVLNSMSFLLKPDDMVLFDEFDHWMDEFRAMRLSEQVSGVRLETACHTKDWAQVAFVVKGTD